MNDLIGVAALNMSFLLIFLLVSIGCIVLGATGWDRYKKPTPMPGTLQATTEVFVDPESGRRMRVWFDPSSGERQYVEEGPSSSPTPRG